MKFWRAETEDNLADVDVESVLANLDRLRTVENTSLMDGPRNQTLDTLTALASRTLGTPMAVLSVVGKDRQFRASDFGITGKMAEVRSESLEYSYCKYVVAYNDVLAVESALDDPLVKDNLGTTENNLRSYLGVPLRIDGHTIGSFCVLDTQPRTWTQSDLTQLEAFAAQALDSIG